MSNYEQDIKDLIERMNKQQQAYGLPHKSNLINENIQPTSQSNISPMVPQAPNNFMGGTDQSPYLMDGNTTSQGPDQTPADPVNSVRPMGSNINGKPPQPAGLKASSDSCPQCGMIHPPLQPGQKCPLAPVKVKGNNQEEKTVDINRFLADLKNIIVSQSEQRGIKDIEKLFKNIIIEVTKYIEGYSE
jgi:hypothetical protein